MKNERNKRLMRIRQGAAEFMDLPPEVVLDLPRITIIGDNRMCIENHKGIVEYTTQRLRVATTCGLLIIDGSALEVKNVGQEEILVLGRVDAFVFQR